MTIEQMKNLINLIYANAGESPEWIRSRIDCAAFTDHRTEEELQTHRVIYWQGNKTN